MKFVQNPRVISRQNKKQLLLLEENRKYIQDLNSSAGFIWESAKKPTTPLSVATKLAKTYGGSSRDYLQDVEEFVQDFLRSGLFLRA